MADDPGLSAAFQFLGGVLPPLIGGPAVPGIGVGRKPRVKLTRTFLNAVAALHAPVQGTIYDQVLQLAIDYSLGEKRHDMGTLVGYQYNTAGHTIVYLVSLTRQRIKFIELV